MEQLGTTGHILEIVRVVRVLRVLRLARHSSSLQIFGKEVQLNIKNLGIYFLFLSIGVVIFATLVFFAENGDNSEHFPDIPAACYWAVITMTTVGYGDKVTKSTIGQVLAVLAGKFCVSLITLCERTVKFKGWRNVVYLQLRNMTYYIIKFNDTHKTNTENWFHSDIQTIFILW